MARVLLGRSLVVRMNDVIDALLLPTANNHGAHVHFDTQDFDPGQRPGSLLPPDAALAGDARLLRERKRRKHRKRTSQPNDL